MSLAPKRHIFTWCFMPNVNSLPRFLECRNITFKRYPILFRQITSLINFYASKKGIAKLHFKVNMIRHCNVCCFKYFKWASQRDAVTLEEIKKTRQSSGIHYLWSWLWTKPYFTQYQSAGWISEYLQNFDNFDINVLKIC